MAETPRILVTNDDGYTSEGIQVLADALEGPGGTRAPAEDTFDDVVVQTVGLDLHAQGREVIQRARVEAQAHVADALVAHLGARGAGCILDLSPTCLTARGDRRHGARAQTHAWAGNMAEDAAARAELLAAAGAQSR